MHVDGDDKFVVGEVVEDAAEIVKHNYWRDADRRSGQFDR
jgi:hypothetical protein